MKLVMRVRQDDPMGTPVTVVAEDVQVAAKPRRRTYTAEYKRRILKEAEACTTAGAIGALLRREGLYSSHLVVWRRARARGELAALAAKKRGRKPTPVDPRDRKIVELERQLAAMTGRAERAEALVDAQKKLAALLDRPGASAPS
jgi:transposase-like protein